MSSPDPSREPPADIRALARSLREMYLALRAEGFTETQALVIVGQVIAGGSRKPPP